MSSLRERTKFIGIVAIAFALLLAAPMVSGDEAQAVVECNANNTVVANVVVFDTIMIHNRLGAQNPNWIMYALRRDVVQGVGNQVLAGEPGPPDPVAGDGLPEAAGGVLEPGNVSLRPDKRPRPIALRVPAGQCLQINFENLLAPAANPFNAFQDALLIDDQVETRFAGVHVQGMQLISSSLGDPINADASYVGENDNSCVEPGDGVATYTLYAEHEGSFLLSNPCAAVGGEASGGNNGLGMWGVVAVEPPDARIYRSQVYEEEFRLAADANLDGLVDATTAQGHPIIDYEAVYPGIQDNTDCDAANPGNPLGAVFCKEGKAGLPILNMMNGNELVHSEINAIVAGPYNDGTFPPSTYPLESIGLRNPTVPNRLEAFREFVSIFHDETATAQAFSGFFTDAVLGHTLHGVRDSFMINYASGGIGSEIIANRLGVGPMYDCLSCAYEEFFLTSFTVGDPGMRVDMPANLGLEQVTPAQVAAQDPALVPFIGPKATTALFQDDPANIHNSYTGDFAKFRNTHAGPKEQHIFHLHNHQWLFNANDDRSNYLDAQGIGPGSSYTYEINFGGSGNRNKTAGDAIFHCHFYPHFAQGMWYHWRHHDVTETGTILAASVDAEAIVNGRYHDDPFELGSSPPALATDTNSAGLTSYDLTGLDTATTRNRAHPDGEILAGIPITAVVPIPGKPMAPMPGDVVLVTKNANPGKDDDPVAVGVQDLDDSSQAHVIERDVNPGFPFWIAGIDCNDDPANCEAGIVGQRPTTPPMDMLTQAEVPGVLAEEPFASIGTSIPLPAGVTRPEYETAFTNAAGGFDGGLPRFALDGCKGSASADPITDVFSCTAAPALHGVGTLFTSAQTRLDFHKEIMKAKPSFYDEAGTDLERVAMISFATRNHPSTALNLDTTTTPGDFVLNGLPPLPGAVYSDPCVSDTGQALEGGGSFNFFSADGFFQGPMPEGRAWDDPFTYAAANIQIDAVFNKVGYHYPQQRIIALWGDVMPTINKEKPPEPFVMRLNSFNCAKYQHSNLVPKEFEVDDYQVRTPTDIIGQHIHLPKWDLSTTDGAANGWNYEDGTLSPGAVFERIEAINAFNTEADNGMPPLEAQPHPALGGGEGGEWLGSRVTLQRWFVDPVVDRDDKDRGLGIIFTHDHYGPSTMQQIGLYSTLLAEPADSTWVHNETGEELGTRQAGCGDPNINCDGGPTSWQAAIIPGGFSAAQGEIPYREFYFEFSDFQHAYEAGVYVGAGPDGRPFTAEDSGHNADGTNVAFPVTADSFRNAINPSFRQQAAPVFPDIVRYPPVCPGGDPRPCPEAISADDIGMFVVNYRNEPVGLRVFDPAALGPDGENGTQANGMAGDLAFALQTRTDRAIPQMNVQPIAGAVGVPAIPIFPTGTQLPTTFPPPINTAGVGDGDPFTPLLRVQQGDLVKVKIQSGATEHEANTTIHGLKWQHGNSGFGPDRLSGGWRNAQSDGISEQFNLSMPVDTDPGGEDIEDYAYATSTGQDGWWTGVWGIIRSYETAPPDLYQIGPEGLQVNNADQFIGACPDMNPQDGIPDNLRPYEIVAISANELLTNALGVTITGNGIPNDPGALPDNADSMHEGGPLDPDGGTLVYNPRATAQNDGNEGPLHDPTALLYVRVEDLEPIDETLRACEDQPARGNNPARPGVARGDCPVRLKDDAPIEPPVLRANAGDCIKVTLFNRLPEMAPDLAGYNTLLQMVVRDREALDGVVDVGMTTFNNNLIRPSSYVGMHPQMMEYDVNISDGVVVGLNPADQIAPPDEQVVYHWYAGHLAKVEAECEGRGRGGGPPNPNQQCVDLVPTPVEFGGTNLTPADKIKQGHKGMIGALVIEPEDANWDDSLALLEQVPNRQSGGIAIIAAGEPADRGTRADLRINAGTGDQFEDLVVMKQSANNHRFENGGAVPNIASEGQGIPEDSHDAGQKGINYGTEPAWFRFGIAADANFGNAGAGGTLGAEDAELMFSNALTGGDPWTPVFTAPAGHEARMRVLNPTGVSRGSTFDLHGHVWARDPYLPETPGCLTGPGPLGDGRTPLLAGGTGCGLSSVAIGLNPLAWYLNGQESWMPYGHFDMVLPIAGGVNSVTGDYLFRDHASFGVTDGVWGILRVEAPPE